MIGSRRYRQRILLACCLLGSVLMLVASPSIAGSSVNTGSMGGIAIMGYDPVAYFTEGRAVKGLPDHALVWLGATWNFANSEHEQLCW
jgi:hypothetical protein